MALLALLGLFAQSDDALIERLKSSEAAEVEKAQAELLRKGPETAAKLRAAPGEPAFRKRAGALADRIEIRAAVDRLVATWKDRWYVVNMGGTKVGWVRLRTEEKEGRLEFSDEIQVNLSPEAQITVRAQGVSLKNEYLSPIRFSIEANVAEQAGTTTGEVREGKLILKTADGEQVIDVKANFVTNFGFLRLACALPKTPGYEIEMLDLLRIKAPVPSVLKFEREEEVEHDGRKVTARRFVLSDPAEGDRTYWVDAEGRLLRVQGQSEIELVLSDETKAKE